jgi:hypothetical protein
MDADRSGRAVKAGPAEKLRQLAMEYRRASGHEFSDGRDSRAAELRAFAAKLEALAEKAPRLGNLPQKTTRRG